MKRFIISLFFGFQILSAQEDVLFLQGESSAGLGLFFYKGTGRKG